MELTLPPPALPSSLLALGAAEAALKEDLIRREAALLDAGGDVTEEESAEYDSLLDSYLAAEMESTGKLEAYGRVLTAAQEEAAVLEARLLNLTRVADAIRRRRDERRGVVRRLKDRVGVYLDLTGRSKIIGDLFVFSWVRNGGPLPAPTLRPDVEVARDVPAEFHTPAVDWDKVRRLCALIEDGIAADAEALDANLKADGVKKEERKVRVEEYVRQERADRYPAWLTTPDRGRHVRVS